MGTKRTTRRKRKEGGEEEDLYGSYQLKQVKYRRKVRPNSEEKEKSALEDNDNLQKPFGLDNNRRGGVKRRSSGRPVKSRSKKALHPQA